MTLDLIFVFVALAAFLWVGLARIERRFVAAYIVVGWTTISAFVYYFVIPYYGGNPPLFELFGAVLPIWYLIPFSILVAIAHHFLGKHKFALFWILFTSLLISYSRPFGLYYRWIQHQASILALLASSIGFIVPIGITLLSPVIAFRQDSRFNIFPIALSSKALRGNAIRMAATAILLFLTIVVRNLIVEGTYFTLTLHTGVFALLAASAIHLIALVLVDHAISLGLMSRVLGWLEPGVEKQWTGVLIYAVVFVGLHYYLSSWNLVMYLLQGGIYGYLFTRTGSLLPGIGLNIVGLLWLNL